MTQLTCCFGASDVCIPIRNKDNVKNVNNLISNCTTAEKYIKISRQESNFEAIIFIRILQSFGLYRIRWKLSHNN